MIDGRKKGKPFLVHHIVLEAFVGPRAPTMDGCHNNGNPSDNRLKNLRWDTRKGNVSDMDLHGTKIVGEGRKNSILKEFQVIEMRQIHAAGEMGYKRLAKKYGVKFSTIVNVIHGKTWKHLQA
jgi:hypothetical protein